MTYVLLAVPLLFCLIFIFFQLGQAAFFFVVRSCAFLQACVLVIFAIGYVIWMVYHGYTIQVVTP